MSTELLDKIKKFITCPTSYAPEMVQTYRLIYSMCGRLALNSVWGTPNTTPGCSIISFKKQRNNVFKAYINLFLDNENYFSSSSTSSHIEIDTETQYNSEDMDFPENRYNWNESPLHPINQIYDIYLRTGHFYHEDYRLSPAMRREASCDVTLIRGVTPHEKLAMSGLGFYKVPQTEAHAEMDTDDIAAMFNLQTSSFDKYIDVLVASSSWQKSTSTEGIEFLDTSSETWTWNQPYWTDNLPAKEIMSLMRTKEPKGAHRSYKLFRRMSDDQHEEMELPSFLLEDYRHPQKGNQFEWLRVANALLAQAKHLPPIKASIYQDIVDIELSYLLPPEEEDFLRLYSWPGNFDKSANFERDHSFHRTMALPIYKLFRKILRNIGYQVNEEYIKS